MATYEKLDKTDKSDKPFASSALRIPPHNSEAEQALLGSVMLNPEIISEVADAVSADSFYAEKHRLIFEAMLELYSNGEPIDILSLSARLKEKETLGRVGGAGYLAELVNSVPSASNAVYYAEIIQKKAVLRNLINVADEVSDLGYNEDEELDTLLDQAEKSIFGITNLLLKQKFTSIKETLVEAWERLDKLHKSKGELRGIPTGFPDIDTKLAGLQKSDLIILAARPSMGKTSLALDIARKAAFQGVPVGIFSIEMSSQQLIDRMLAAESGVDSWKLRTGKLEEKDFPRIRDSLDRLSRAPIFINDEPGTNIIKMRSIARRLKNKKGLGLIIVDYLQLMVPHTRANDSLVQQITEISRALKGLARELDIPVLALSQLSRDVEKRGGRPRLSDLRDSGALEQDADVVMFIHRDMKDREDGTRSNNAEILIEKHRNGPTGKVDLMFDEKTVSFFPIDKRREDFGGF
jgi:replicative DNA helicase